MSREPRRVSAARVAGSKRLGWTRALRSLASVLVFAVLGSCQGRSWNLSTIVCESGGTLTTDLSSIGLTWDELVEPQLGFWDVDLEFEGGGAVTGGLTVEELTELRGSSRDCDGPGFALRTVVDMTLSLDGRVLVGRAPLRWYDLEATGPGLLEFEDEAVGSKSQIRVSLAEHTLSGTDGPGLGWTAALKR